MRESNAKRTYVSWKCSSSYKYPAHASASWALYKSANHTVAQTVLHEGTQSRLKRSGAGNHQAKHSDAATQRHVIQFRQEKAELKHEISVLRVRRPPYGFFCGVVCVEKMRVKFDCEFVFIASSGYWISIMTQGSFMFLVILFAPFSWLHVRWFDSSLGPFSFLYPVPPASLLAFLPYPHVPSPFALMMSPGPLLFSCRLPFSGRKQALEKPEQRSESANGNNIIDTDGKDR